jgi:hypothetical protein
MSDHLPSYNAQADAVAALAGINRDHIKRGLPRMRETELDLLLSRADGRVEGGR